MQYTNLGNTDIQMSRICVGCMSYVNRQKIFICGHLDRKIQQQWLSFKGRFRITYGYARVSTKVQAKDGNSLEAQEKALIAAGTEKIFTDSFTGTKIERPQFTELRSKLQSGNTLIVTKLD